MERVGVGQPELPEIVEEDGGRLVEGAFDPYLFDSQYLRYAQILDTDYLNYMVIY